MRHKSEIRRLVRALEYAAAKAKRNGQLSAAAEIRFIAGNMQLAAKETAAGIEALIEMHRLQNPIPGYLLWALGDEGPGSCMLAETIEVLIHECEQQVSERN